MKNKTMTPTKYKAWDGEKMLPPEDLTQSPEHRTWLGKYDYTLRLFTGVPDRTGEEIYDGDVVRFHIYLRHDEYLGYVEHDEIREGYIIKWKDGGFVIINEMEQFSLTCYVVDWIEITGNVFVEPHRKKYMELWHK